MTDRNDVADSRAKYFVAIHEGHSDAMARLEVFVRDVVRDELAHPQQIRTKMVDGTASVSYECPLHGKQPRACCEGARRREFIVAERPTNDELGELNALTRKAPSRTSALVNKLIDYVRDENHRGLTHAEIEVACRNVGIDLECGACATQFYTGSDPEDLSHTTNCPRQEQIGKSINDGRYDIARVLVEKAFCAYFHHEPYTDLEQKIVDDPYDGIEAVFKEYDTRKAAPKQFEWDGDRGLDLSHVEKARRQLWLTQSGSAMEPQTRQGYTDGGLPSMPGAAGTIPSDARAWGAIARQRTQLLSFATRFALELRKHGAFGMNREEGELLKEFDEWMRSNGASKSEPRAL